MRNFNVVKLIITAYSTKMKNALNKQGGRTFKGLKIGITRTTITKVLAHTAQNIGRRTFVVY